MNKYSIVISNDAIYKLIGDERTLKEYIEKNKSTNITDWSGFYFQLSKNHALEALGYRYDKNYKIANLLCLRLNNAKLIKFTNNTYLCDPNINQDQKAQYVKHILNIDNSKKLVNDLEYDGLMIEERQDEYEIIIPIEKVTSLIIDEYILESHDTKNIMSNTKIIY